MRLPPPILTSPVDAGAWGPAAGKNTLFAKSGLIPRRKFARKLVCDYAAAQIRQRLGYRRALPAEAHF
jgi:hypothetical protein